MSRLIFSPLLFLASLSMLACENGSDASVEKLRETFSNILDSSDEAIRGLSALSPEDAKKEINKLREFEYRVLEYPADVSAKALEVDLQALGALAWDCTPGPLRIIEDEKSVLMVFCKRRPDTPLRYIPQTLLGRQ